MAIAIRGARRRLLTRRQFLNRSASTLAVAGLASIAKPYLSRASDRPLPAAVFTAPFLPRRPTPKIAETPTSQSAPRPPEAASCAA